MKKIFQFLGLFFATVLFLSIEIKDKTIFGHIHTMISPSTRAAQNAIASFFNRSVDNTHSYSKRLFDNSIPKAKDSIKSKMSSSKKVGKPLEEITHLEKEELDELIKSHN